jgi:hypothetical protein
MDEGLGAIRHPGLDAQGKPGLPEGADVQGARLLYDLIEARFGARYIV